MSSSPPKADRFPILFTQWGLIPVAVVLLAGWAIFSDRLGLRIAAGVLALVTIVVGSVLFALRPWLVVDDEGYAVWERGREKLRVAWREVVAVRADADEHACYVDCGDPTRNLLVPPRRGFGFRFERQEALYARVLAAVDPACIEHVNQLTKAPTA